MNSFIFFHYLLGIKVHVTRIPNFSLQGMCTDFQRSKKKTAGNGTQKTQTQNVSGGTYFQWASANAYYIFDSLQW